MTAPTPPEPSRAPDAVRPDAVRPDAVRPDAVRPDAMTAAASELEQLQELLRRAAQGQVEFGEVERSLSDYWREHGQSLATAAAAVGEQARGQMLAQLYAWRAQLGQQLARSNTSTPPSEPEEDIDRRQ